jgi:hypothetical protein
MYSQYHESFVIITSSYDIRRHMQRLGIYFYFLTPTKRKGFPLMGFENTVKM